jgi:hypothetical protein
MSDPSGLQISDVDQDGLSDLVCVSPADHRVLIFFQNSNGGFDSLILEDAAIQLPRRVVVADLDDDGDHDIASANFNSSNVTIFRQAGARLFSATPEVLQDQGINSPIDLGVADVDGDGRVDLVSANYFSNNMAVFFQSSDGFSAAPMILSGATRSSTVDLLDLDSDGRLDIVTSERTGGDKIHVFYQDKDRQFSLPETLRSGLFDTPTDVDGGDVDGDGETNLLVSYLDGRIAVFDMIGAREFRDPPRIIDSGVREPEEVHIVDLDGDGDLDVVVGSDDAQEPYLSILFSSH